MKPFRLLPVLLALVCCNPSGDNSAQTLVSLRFESVGQTKSSLVSDTDTIKDINVFVFRGGLLEYSGYSADPASGMRLKLTVGGEYDIYAVANAGEIDYLGFDEDTFRMLSVECCGTGPVPMAAHSRISVRKQSEIILSLDRLVSKIYFNFVTDNVTDGLKINSVRIRQAAGDVAPFMDGGSRPSYTVSGDYASPGDIAALNNGGTVVLYAGENSLGELLPSNTNPWSKTPDNLPEELREMCTYLEVSTSFDTDLNIHSGDVVYRFFLGKNNTTDFSLMRNCEYHVTLLASGSGLDHGVSWKISSDAKIEDGHGRVVVAGGNKTSLGDMYAGEKYLLEIIPDTPLLSYFAGDLTYCTLGCDNGEEFRSSITFGAIENRDGRFYSAMKCVNPDGNLNIRLYDMMGRLVQTCVRDLSVKQPKIVLDSDEILPVYVNGAMLSGNIYLSDDKGNRLGGIWFDNSVIDLEADAYAALNKYSGAGRSISSTILTNLDGDSAYGTLILSSSYGPGDEVSDGYSIVDALSMAGAVTLRLREKNLRCTQLTRPLMIMAQGVTVGHDDFKSSVFNSRKLIGVSPREITLDNPSNLPISLKAYSYAWYGEPHASGLAPGTEVKYTMGTYKVKRNNAVCYNTQEFVYTDVVTREVNFGNTTVSDGKYRIPSDDMLIADINPYIQLGRSNRNDPTAVTPDPYGPVLWSVFDVTFQGASVTRRINDLKTDCQKATSTDSAVWTWGGVALYSKDNYITRSDGTSYDCCIYSPVNVETNLISGGVATLWGSTDKNTNGTTRNLTARLDGGKQSRLEINWKQACAVVLHLSGTAYSASYKWISPVSYNSGGSRFSPGSSYTSSNYTYNAALSSSNSVNITPGSQYYTAFGVQSFIDANIFTRYEKDYGGKLLATNSYNHQYHPVNFSMYGKLNTLDKDWVYLVSFASDFNSSAAGSVIYSYRNDNYGGKSYNTDYSTSWTFNNILMDKSVNGEIITTSNAYHLTK